MEMYIRSSLNNKIKYFSILFISKNKNFTMVNQICLYKHVTMFIFKQYTMQNIWISSVYSVLFEIGAMKGIVEK